MEADPASHFACWLTLWALSFTGRLREEGDPILDRLMQEGPDTPFGQWAAVLKAALEGNRDAALQAVTPELLSWARSDDIGSLAVAGCYAVLDMQDEVLAWLANAIAVGSTSYPLVTKNPYLMQVLRGPRAEEFLDRFRVLWETQEL